MNGTQLNSNAPGSGKPVPGCLGRMVNLFDLTSNISGNRLLTDKPYNDGNFLILLLPFIVSRRIHLYIN